MLATRESGLQLVFTALAFVALVVFESAAFAQRIVTPEEFEDSQPETSVLETAVQRANQSGAPIFVIAGRKTCPPCIALKQLVRSDAQTRELLRDCIKVYLDCDSEEYQRWISNYPPTDNVLPQWFLARADGRLLINRTGGASGEEFNSILGPELSRAGKLLSKSDSIRIEELVGRVNELIEEQDVLSAAEEIMNSTSTLRVASDNYAAPSNRLRQTLENLQEQLLQQIESASSQLSELETLEESSQTERKRELQTLIERLQSVPSVATELRNLESKFAELQKRAKTSVRR